ncbi:MAG: phosphoglucosamine mutase [Prochloron sp. SP5CPC1]|nr:phosphoglucosamine mutase [Candidatus Paraprochloron terpiosi SP5CPC1]
MKKQLIVSISGLRGIYGEGLDLEVVIRFAAGFALLHNKLKNNLVIGRDGRSTGRILSRAMASLLQAMGWQVIDVRLVTTPTIAMAVPYYQAVGGIMITASHNPPEWNGIKFLNGSGEFISAEDWGLIEAWVGSEEDIPYTSYDKVGDYNRVKDALTHHIEAILALPYIHKDTIRARNFKIVVDGANSVGSIAIPALLEALGVFPERIVKIHDSMSGNFERPGEPLEAHLEKLREVVVQEDANLGLAVDPDGDRLALVDNNGVYVNEELTQVIAADFLWGFRSGPFVTNLSSSMAIDTVAQKYGMKVYRSSVGELNVVQKMKAVGAILGGEGNGGVILPEVHYGRDSLVGTALLLQHLANQEISLAQLRGSLPQYVMIKEKMALGSADVGAILARLAAKYAHENISTEDGLRVTREDSWVHIRASNTEPILRIYGEAKSKVLAEDLVGSFKDFISRKGAKAQRGC